MATQVEYIRVSSVSRSNAVENKSSKVTACPLDSRGIPSVRQWIRQKFIFVNEQNGIVRDQADRIELHASRLNRMGWYISEVVER